MGIWEAMEKLSELVDDSDPDVGVSRRLRCLLLFAIHRRPPFLAALVFNFPCGHRLCALRHFFPSLPKTSPSHQQTCSLTMLPGVLIPVPTLTHSHCHYYPDRDP